MLRFRGLGDDSLWIDEAATWKQTRGDVLSTIIDTGRDTYPPLYNLFTLAAVKLFGATEWALRVPAAIAGTLAIPAAYWVGKLAGGRQSGLLAALLMALAPFALFYSQEARAYSLLMLAATLYIGCAIGFLSRRTRWLGAGLVASAFVLLYSHPYGILTWVSVSGAAAIMLLRRDGWRAVFQFAGLQAIAVTLFAPWILITLRVVGQIADQGSWLSMPSWARGAEVLLSVAGGTWTLAAIAVAVAGLALPRAGDTNVAAYGSRAILVSALVGPVVLGVAFSLTVGSIFSDRYFIACLPPLLVLAALGLVRIAAFRQWGAALVLAVVAAFAVSSALVPVTGRHGEDWRAAAAYLEAQLQPEDCLVVHEDFVYRALEYYLRQPPVCVAIELDKAATKVPATAVVYVVLSHAGGGMTAVAETLGREAPGTSLEFGERIEIARLAPR